MQPRDAQPIGNTREPSVCSERLIRGVIGVESADGHQVPHRSTVYSGPTQGPRPIVIAPGSVRHTRRWERDAARRADQPRHSARSGVDSRTNTNTNTKVNTATTSAISTCTTRSASRTPAGNRVQETRTRGQHSVMMTATSTDADANAAPATQQECVVQMQVQMHTPAPVQPAQQPVEVGGTHRSTLDMTADTGAVAPPQERAETRDHDHDHDHGTEQGHEGSEQETDVTSMIAREGSELAQRLRASGWVARAGWRSSDATGRPVWHLRFEQPTTTFNT